MAEDAPENTDIAVVYARYQGLTEEAETLSKQLELLRTSLADVEQGIATLSKLKELGGGVEIKLPIGGGAFVDAHIKDISSVMVSIGGGFSVERDIGGAMEHLEQRKSKLSNAHEQGMRVMGEISAEIERLASLLKQVDRLKSGTLTNIR